MNVLSQFGQASERIDQIATESNRVRRGKAEPRETVDSVDSFEKLHKRTLAASHRKFVTPVEIHDLAEQRHFPNPLANECANFRDNFFDRPAPLLSAGLRHDAECAMHVASLHDRNKRGCLSLSDWLVAN